ncbi:MAG: hypothetical protein INR64_03025 [Caulobacteraceae bacterium]|nr:hypothetical protein [Caulobacter sp.]
MNRLLAASALATTLCATAARGDDARFTFQAAEFLDEDRARAAGLAWAQTQLPPGLPLADAVGRAKTAGMTCRPPRPPGGDVRCRYSMVVHKPGGIIGEDNFILELAPDASGRLRQARLVYNRDGVPE